jgi:hypothetical protein
VAVGLGVGGEEGPGIAVGVAVGAGVSVARDAVGPSVRPARGDPAGLAWAPRMADPLGADGSAEPLLPLGAGLPPAPRRAVPTRARMATPRISPPAISRRCLVTAHHQDLGLSREDLIDLGGVPQRSSSSFLPLATLAASSMRAARLDGALPSGLGRHEDHRIAWCGFTGRTPWGSETPIRARTVPVRSADVVSPLPRRPSPRPSPRQCRTAWSRRRIQGPRDPRPPPPAPRVAPPDIARVGRDRLPGRCER